MKKVKLFIYNYGITQVADFKSNLHDAIKCSTMFNNELVNIHGQLPEKTFYFVSYMSDGKLKVSVDFGPNTTEAKTFNVQQSRQVFILSKMLEASLQTS